MKQLYVTGLGNCIDFEDFGYESAGKRIVLPLKQVERLTVGANPYTQGEMTVIEVKSGVIYRLDMPLDKFLDILALSEDNEYEVEVEK